MFTDREARKVPALTANSPFAEWTKAFGDRLPCTAIADRITFHCPSHPDQHRVQPRPSRPGRTARPKDD
ncbi:ATP-binding protein [Streptomyces sp. NPDC057743]|uniref:ATP-binding protein n=1 Tax=Streptomyces sp. NPDC057743 TaxID=3346236 RepID=UPI0036929328